MASRMVRAEGTRIASAMVPRKHNSLPIRVPPARRILLWHLCPRPSLSLLCRGLSVDVYLRHAGFIWFCDPRPSLSLLCRGLSANVYLRHTHASWLHLWLDCAIPDRRHAPLSGVVCKRVPEAHTHASGLGLCLRCVVLPHGCRYCTSPCGY